MDSKSIAKLNEALRPLDLPQRIALIAKSFPDLVFTTSFGTEDQLITWAIIDGGINLSGKLGHVKSFDIPTKYIGPLSRFTPSNTVIKNNLMVLLSGPEPQRTLLEEKLLSELKNYPGKVVFLKGIIEKKQTIESTGNMTIYNFMTTDLLEKTINESALIISRSGYTTIMDLAKLNKKAFFIPTPGQFEQEYLAERLTEMCLVPSCKQDDFTLKKLKDVSSYEGLKSFDFEVSYNDLFSLF